ncbi:MAG: acetyltransferase, family [Dehalococcoidia bacterium]|nr:acetyltransferase, family [Dehalococcoidia bacterium]
MIKGERIILREKRLEDAPVDYAWRIDEELSGLDATPPLNMSYPDYLRLFQDELRHPFPWSKRFAVETLDGKLIGNCMYYDIDMARSQTELGIMIGDKEYWSQGYGTDIVNTLVNYIFTNTSLKRVYLHTLTWNLRAQSSFQKCGFVSLRKVRRGGYEFLLMELLRDRWEELRNGLTPKEAPEA